MKRKFTLFSIALFALVSGNVKAQTTYFNEGFIAGTTTLTTLQPNATNGYQAGTFTTPAGTWYGFGVYSTAGPTGACAGQSPDHPRFGNLSSVTGYTAADSAYIVTPVVNFGINTFTYFNTRASRRISIFKTSGTDPLTSTWVPVYYVGTTNAACDMFTATINDATAKRLKIVTRSGTDSDLDSFIMTSTSVIMPVNFTGAKAYLKNNGINVEWNVANEVNIANYVVERSSNGSVFANAGTITTTGTKAYAWFDAAPLSGNNFYRIKATDKDGSVKYTSVLRVNTVTSSATLNVAPNPVKSNVINIQLAGVQKGSYTINLYNNFGQQVYSKAVTAEGASISQSLNLPSGITKGAYNLQVTSADVKLNKKVIIE